MTHRASDVKVDLSCYKQHKVTWDDISSVGDWLKTQPTQEWKDFFEQNGYLKVENLLSEKEVEVYKDVYQKMLDGDIDTSSHRHDLGNHMEAQKPGQENICQIMWPSLYVQGFEPKESPLHQRAVAVAKVLLGDDSDFDFDMLIYKPPYSPAETPWHQDESYWADMPDKRAVSCWCALDEVTAENGCMWFVPGSHKTGVRTHRPVVAGKHVLTCQDVVDKTEGVPVPLNPGSCTFHHGVTCHHTGPNTTATHRRAYIVNIRPKAMVEYERQVGQDHGQKGLTGLIGHTKTHAKN